MECVYLSCKDISKMTEKSVRTVWKWVQSGRLKAYCPGGRDYLIKESDFEDFMNSNTRSKHDKGMEVQ